jgi:hypothetical protein
LVSTCNPNGSITNSDLELAATIAQHHILEEAGYPMAGESTHILDHFNSTYPQSRPWQMRHLWPQVLSELILLLYRQKWQLLYRQKWQP